MAALTKIVNHRLDLVAETPDAKGKYALEDFKLDRPVTSGSSPSPAASSKIFRSNKTGRIKPERIKAPCHRMLCTPATYSVSSIGVTINRTPHRFTFMGHEISVSADSPVKLDMTDWKVLDFILILLTKYLPAAGP